MDKQVEVYLYNCLLLGSEKKQAKDMHNNMDE